MQDVFLGQADPVLSRFLAFLTQDMANHPERLKGVTQELRDRLAALVDQVVKLI